MEDEVDFEYSEDDSVIKWEPWKKKFAVLPKNVPGGKVWLGTYYERKGRNLFATFRQWGTLLDVIRNSDV